MFTRIFFIDLRYLANQIPPFIITLKSLLNECST